jgi:uncharacterized membrane protein
MNSPLDVYLDELGKGLRPLPIHERLEQLDEARAHLEGLTESYQELGHEEQESQVRAIAQFGEVKCIAQELNRAAKKQRWAHTLAVAAIFLGIQQLCNSALLIPLLNSNLLKPLLPLALIPPVLASLAALVSGGLMRLLVPGRTLRPLALVGAMGFLFTMVLWLKYPGAISPALHWLLMSGLSFLTSGAFGELRCELQRRSRSRRVKI